MFAWMLLQDNPLPTTEGSIDDLINALLGTPQGQVILIVAVTIVLLFRFGSFKSLLSHIADKHDEGTLPLPAPSAPETNGNTSKALELALAVARAREESLEDIAELESMVAGLTEELREERARSQVLIDRLLIAEPKLNEQKTSTDAKAHIEPKS